MSKKNEKKRKRWAELLGFYRDERIDAVSRLAFRWTTYVTAVLLFILAILLLTLNEWSGAFILLILAVTGGYLRWQWGKYGGSNLDEWGQYQYERQYLYSAIVLLCVAPLLWVLPLESQLPDFVWPSVFALCAFVSPAVQLWKQAYPWQTWALALFAGFGGGVFGWFAAVGAFSTTTILLIGLAYLLFATVLMVYWWRQRKW